MDKAKLLGNWTGAGRLVEAALIVDHERRRRNRKRGIWIFALSAILALIIIAVESEVHMMVFTLTLFGPSVLHMVWMGYNPGQCMEYVEKYKVPRDRLAKALGIEPDELESMEYDRLRSGIVLPTLDGLFAKLRAQAASCFEEDARATYDELAELHGACPPFRLLDGTDGRYTLEPFESYNQLLVVA